MSIEVDFEGDGDGGAGSLADTLVIGNTSGANDIIINAGQSLVASRIVANATPIIIEDSVGSQGLVYLADYSANFTDRSLVDKQYSDFGSYLAQNVQPTGIIFGLNIQSFTDTTLNITSGVGLIADYSVPDIPSARRVIRGNQPAYAVVNLLAAGSYLVGIDVNENTIEVLASIASNMDFKDLIIIGGYITDGAKIISTTNTPFNIGYGGSFTPRDFIGDVIGPANVNGNIISNNGTDMTLKNTGGTVFVLGANFRNDSEIPDEPIIPAENQFTFQKIFRTADNSDVILEGAPTTVVDPGQVNLNGSGALSAVGNNNFTVQVIYITREKEYIVSYGQEIFNTLQDAEDALTTGAIVIIEPPPVQVLVRRSFVILKGNAADLSNLSEAKFFTDGKFRTGIPDVTGGIPSINIPGGADTNLQFNDAGVFGGDADLSWDNALKALTVNGLNIGGTNSSAFLNTKIIPTAANFTVAIGPGAGQSLIDGLANNLVGVDCGTALTSGNRNNAFGRGCLQNLTTGDDNVAFGPFALLNLSGGASDNVAFGKDAGGNLVTGGGNLYLGTQAGLNHTSGSDCILIGTGANSSASGKSNFLNLGGLLFGDLLNQRLTIGGPLLNPTGPETLNVQGDTVLAGDLSLLGDLVTGNAVIGPSFVSFNADVSLDLISTTQVFRANQLDAAAVTALTPNFVNAMWWYNTSLNKFQGVENGALVTFTTS